MKTNYNHSIVSSALPPPLKITGTESPVRPPPRQAAIRSATQNDLPSPSLPRRASLRERRLASLSRLQPPLVANAMHILWWPGPACSCLGLPVPVWACLGLPVCWLQLFTSPRVTILMEPLLCCKRYSLRPLSC